MNGSNQNYTPPEYFRTGLDYGGYSARPDSRNRLSSLFPPPAGGPLDRRGGDPDPRLLFGVGNPGGFLGISSFPASPHLQNQTQFFNSDTTRNTIPWPPAAIALPNFQPQPSMQGPQDGSKLSQEEQKKVLNRLKKEAYNPVTKLSRRKPNLYYRDSPLTISKELEKEKHEEGKRCAICLEDFEPKEMVTITPCNHMFHEECIVPWLKNEGRCPVCRFAISERFGETAAGSSNVTANDHSGTGADLHWGQWGSSNVTANDHSGSGSDLIAIIRAMEEAFVPGNMRRFVEFHP